MGLFILGCIIGMTVTTGVFCSAKSNGAASQCEDCRLWQEKNGLYEETPQRPSIADASKFHYDELGDLPTHAPMRPKTPDRKKNK